MPYNMKGDLIDESRAHEIADASQKFMQAMMSQYDPMEIIQMLDSMVASYVITLIAKTGRLPSELFDPMVADMQFRINAGNEMVKAGKFDHVFGAAH